jgi:tRNA-2-methylthio-N6-dimethylallyladenosine synthase
VRVVEEARFAVAYTFQYSKRPGTPAAEFEDQIPKAVVQKRYERLLEVVNRVALEENQKQIGRTVEVLVAGDGRKDDRTNRVSGRAKDFRLVHFEVPAGTEPPRPGDLVTCTITEAAPYHLIADLGEASTYSVQKTVAGDAWDRAEAAACAVPADGASSARVSLELTVKPRPERH